MENLINVKINEIYKALNSRENTQNISLFSGLGGIALFNFYYAKKYSSQEAYDKGFDQISKIFDVINSGFGEFSFTMGLAGIAWLIDHLVTFDFLEEDTVGILDDLDELLTEIMISEMQKGYYDYLHGALGVGLYLSKRKKSNHVNQKLNIFINILEEKSEIDGNGLKWVSVLRKLTGEQGYNISLSHGIISIANILGRFNSLSINNDKVKLIVERTVNYVINQKNEPNKYSSIYPNFSKEDSKMRESRLSWCYGDLGIASTLWQLSQKYNREDWKEEALDVFEKNTKRQDLVKNMVYDAGLCHGSAGVAHIFNRMFMNTGNKLFKEAANYWFKITLEMANKKDGIAGFKQFLSIEQQSVVNPGFLEGAAGIGLALLSADNQVDPAWDEMLLLS